MKFTLLLLAFGIVAISQAQTDSTKRYTTACVKGTPPVIDGLLNDEAWDQVEWAGGDFRQVNPDKGKPASVQTKFKILYDDKNLYAIFRCYDPEPEKIVKRMSRRDSFDGDWVEIHIDSYYDKRTAFSFTASVSGVKSDEYVSNNGDDWDASWDPIWYMKTSIDKEGWIAEMRIPLSQLRFTNKEELVWGLNVQRRFFRNQENSRWQYIPPDAAGYVHLMGEMNGIKGIKPQKQLEIQPYLVTKAETFQKEEGNPYATGTSTAADVGLDAKIGITSDITLDLTVNPDFGQVEADPSQVNLSAFELFFREQRPFFTEGANTLDFSFANNESNLFYSRRVGRQPQGWADPDKNGEDGVNEYVKPVNRTKILGAAKLSGKNKKGFSWALMESVTAREYAEIDSLGHKRREQIEPLTNYFVMRAQQDFNQANTVVGGMFTAVNRQLQNTDLTWLRRSAYTGGLDVLHHWSKRRYYISAKGMLSHVEGSAEAISVTQRSSVRFFQRPDNKHTEFDPNRKSLTGTGGQVVVGKKSGNLVSDLGVVWQSPELELNDAGFMPQTDIISQWFWMQYRILKPKGIARSQRFNINEWREYDFGGRNLNEGYNVNAHAEFKNFWQAGTGVTYRVRGASNSDLRGGPTLRYPGRLYYWGYINTDFRKKFYASLTPEFGFGNEHFARSIFMQLRLTWRPTNALNLSVAPSYSHNENEMQYVTTAEVSGEPRYIVARIDQNTVRMVIRATYMLTPNLSIQYYGQPFGTAGRYSKFKSITNASATEYVGRFVPLNPTFNANTYWVDENNDNVPDYSYGKPDFNFGQFRSNMVMRWEYIPGSTFFLVWTRERNGEFYDSHPEHKSYSFNFDQKGHNIFLMKFTYRFRA